MIIMNVNIFLKTGYTLSISSNYALIIRYVIENKIYDFEELLFLVSQNLILIKNMK
jgi:hypothetical protein